MDIVGELPFEIGIHILSYMSYRDLVKCFSVSKRWRDLANCNWLWKKHCLTYATSDEIRKAISRVVRPGPTAYLIKNLRYCLRPRDNVLSRNRLGAWCGCAQLFKKKYKTLLCNWKNGNSTLGYVELREPVYNVICFESSLCFFNSNMFAIAVLSANRIGELKYFDIPSPQLGQYDSVKVSCNYIIVSYKNTILVYKKSSSDYVYYKTFVMNDDCEETVEITNFDDVIAAEDLSLEVCLICDHYAWFRSKDNIYVVNLECGCINKINLRDSHIKHGSNSHKVVAWSQRHIMILTDHGDLLYESQTRSYIFDVAFDQTFTLLIRVIQNPTAFIAWWDPQADKRKVLKTVEDDTTMVVHGENVYILEVLTPNYHRLSAIHCISGITHWTRGILTHPIPLVTFPQNIIFEVIHGKYLFIKPPNHYHVIDIHVGDILYTNEYGWGKAYLFNNSAVVVAKRELTWIINYL